MARRKRRPKLETKEELVKYLEENQDTEYPFNEEVWKLAVEKTAEKEREFKVLKEVDFDGTEKVKKIPNGAINPVSKYFQLIALPQYKKQCEELQKEQEEELVADVDDMLEQLDDSEENTFIRELVTIYFSNVKGEDLDFVIDRLSDYYSNYEFNEGSDKFLVVSAVSDELTLRELYGKRVKGSDNEVKIEKVKKGYLSTLDGLKLLKKQGSKLEDGKNKFTMFVDELEKAGELKFDTKGYEPDQIDRLIEHTRRSIVRAFSDG